MERVSISRETQISVAASAMFPGFRFSPTDEELISYYLKKKVEGLDKCVEVIADIDFCKFEPWDLPAKSIIHSDNEWFFFSARGRKYPNGSQSRRATELGYWKATGKERNVKSGTNVIGTKRTLVFHIGRAPKGERTEWIMHEYCMAGQAQDSIVVCRLRRNTDFRPNENATRASQGRRGIDQTGTSRFGGTSKAVESSSKKCSSSHDSHSVEQNDSASEAEQKQSNDFILTESSNRHKDSEDDEEDCYADILKDDIIKLDESASLSDTLNLVAMVVNRPDSDRTTCQQPLEQPTMTTVPVQGTAYRRIRLKNRCPGQSSSSGGLGSECCVSLESAKCVMSRLTSSHRLMSIVLVVMTLLVLSLCADLHK